MRVQIEALERLSWARRQSGQMWSRFLCAINGVSSNDAVDGDIQQMRGQFGPLDALGWRIKPCKSSAILIWDCKFKI